MNALAPGIAGVHPLIDRLASSGHAAWVDAASIDAFIGAPGDHVVFLHHDPVRFPECLDVAVVLPQLQAAFPDRFDLGVIAPQDAEALSQRYGSPRWPSLLFFRDGRYVATLSGILDWADYLAQVARTLAMPPTHAPIRIPLRLEGAGATDCARQP